MAMARTIKLFSREDKPSLEFDGRMAQLDQLSGLRFQAQVLARFTFGMLPRAGTLDRNTRNRRGCGGVGGSRVFVI